MKRFLSKVFLWDIFGFSGRTSSPWRPWRPRPATRRLCQRKRRSSVSWASVRTFLTLWAADWPLPVVPDRSEAVWGGGRGGRRLLSHHLRGRQSHAGVEEVCVSWDQCQVCAGTETPPPVGGRGLSSVSEWSWRSVWVFSVVQRTSHQSQRVRVFGGKVHAEGLEESHPAERHHAQVRAAASSTERRGRRRQHGWWSFSPVQDWEARSKEKLLLVIETCSWGVFSSWRTGTMKSCHSAENMF